MGKRWKLKEKVVNSKNSNPDLRRDCYKIEKATYAALHVFTTVKPYCDLLRYKYN